MKVFSVVIKILVALAAVAGAVYIAATYGDKIVAWAKNLLNSCKCCCDCDCDCDCDCEDVECECCCEEAAEEIAETAEAPAVEAAATEADFEG